VGYGDEMNEEKQNVQVENSIAMEAKRIFTSFHEEYHDDKRKRMERTQRITISTNWSESGSSGIQILEAVEKKQKLNEEKEAQKEKEKEEKEEEKRRKKKISKRKERKKEKRLRKKEKS
jgi:hypothetical protein